MYEELIEKRDFLNKHKNLLSKEALENYELSFNIEFAHNSTAIEGNTLTLMETKLLLEDEISVKGKDLREIYEVVNHNKAWKYVLNLINKNLDLDEEKIKKIHSILMENIMEGGEYRETDVIITGTNHRPPSPFIAKIELEKFFKTLKNNNFNDIELATYTHAEFVKIHPFPDGNGRTARIIMNYQLLKNNFLGISINKEDKDSYFKALDEYHLNNNLKPFINLISKLEEKQLDFYIKQVNYCLGD